MKNFFTQLLTFFLSFGVPFSAGAAQAGVIDKTYLEGYKNIIIDVINNYLVGVLIAVAFITFLWGVYKYFIVPDGEREEGKQFIMYGIIGFVVIFSVWGLVNIVKDTIILDGGNSTAPSYPVLPTKAPSPNQIST